MTTDERDRINVATAFIHSGAHDSDEIDPLQWRACESTCSRKCGCSGVPYISDALWQHLGPVIANLRAEGIAADLPKWMAEILHVVSAFADREHEGQIVTLVPEHAAAALRAAPAGVLRAAGIPNSGPHSCPNCEGVDPASCVFNRTEVER